MRNHLSDKIGGAGLAAVICLASGGPAAAGRENPFFGGYENQAGLYVGASTGGGNIWKIFPMNDWDAEPFAQTSLQYSQPFEFFRLPARQNIHAAMMWGWRSGGQNMGGYTDPVGGISWDVALLRWRGVYLGAGLGGYIKPKYHGRQDSLFMFGEKLFLGYRISERWSAEAFTQHFDDGGLTCVDGGYNFVGLAVLVNF